MATASEVPRDRLDHHRAGQEARRQPSGQPFYRQVATMQRTRRNRSFPAGLAERVRPQGYAPRPPEFPVFRQRDASTGIPAALVDGREVRSLRVQSQHRDTSPPMIPSLRPCPGSRHGHAQKD